MYVNRYIPINISSILTPDSFIMTMNYFRYESLNNLSGVNINLS